MHEYLAFVAISAIYIASPGPGVLLTLSNSFRCAVFGALPGILGIALGMFCVGVISATGLAILLSASALAFTLFKYAGAVYLVYLGIRHWRAASEKLALKTTERNMDRRRFTEGLAITLLNPKASLFYLALFPQFIDANDEYWRQFLFLAVTFSCLLVAIHLLYSVLMNLARPRLESALVSRTIQRAAGALLASFGVALAALRRTA